MDWEPEGAGGGGQGVTMALTRPGLHHLPQAGRQLLERVGVCAARELEPDRFGGLFPVHHDPALDAVALP